jgi:transcription initiation factor TFIIB
MSTVRTAADLAPEPNRSCPECGGDVRPDGIHETCRNCGLIVDTRPIDHGKEWRPFDADGRERTGPPSTNTRHDRNLGTDVSDALPYRLRWQHRRAHKRNKTERGRAYSFGEIHRLTDVLELPDVVVETACQYYKRAQESGLVQGRSHDGIAAAATVAAARIHELPVTFEAVERVARTGEPNAGDGGVYHCYQRLNDGLDVPVPPPDPGALVPGICRELKLDERVRTRAEQLAREHADELVGHKPQGIAAAAVYLVTGGQWNGELTQCEIGEAAGCTAPTLRKCLRVMEGEDER